MPGSDSLPRGSEVRGRGTGWIWLIPAGRPSPGQGRSQAPSSGDHLAHPLRGSQLFPGARREGRERRRLRESSPGPEGLEKPEQDPIVIFRGSRKKNELRVSWPPPPPPSPCRFLSAPFPGHFHQGTHIGAGSAPTPAARKPGNFPLQGRQGSRGPFGERTRDCSPGHPGKEGPQLARTGASQGFPRAAAPVGVFSRAKLKSQGPCH